MTSGPSRMQMECAAILIQANFRAHLVRRDFKVLKMLHGAARTIQNFWRVHRRKDRVLSSEPPRLE
jgi:hypothetical protein